MTHPFRIFAESQIQHFLLTPMYKCFLMDLTVLLSYRAAHRRNVKTWIARGRSGIGEGECDGPNKNWDTRLNFLNPMFEEEILGTYKLDNLMKPSFT